MLPHSGIPYLSFEMGKTQVAVFNDPHQLVSSFLIKEFSFLNIENQSAPQVLARSGNYAAIEASHKRRESMDQTHELSVLHDLEDEDNMEAHDEDLDDFLFRAFFEMGKESKEARVNAVLGMIEVEAAESNIRKFIDSFVVGWPQSPSVPVEEQSNLASVNEVTGPSKPVKFDGRLEWQGIIARLRVKKDVSTLKVLGLSAVACKNDQALNCCIELTDL